MCPETQAPWPQPASPATLSPISAHIGAPLPQAAAAAAVVVVVVVVVVLKGPTLSPRSFALLLEHTRQPWKQHSRSPLQTKPDSQTGAGWQHGRIAARHQHDPWPQKTDSKDLLITKGKRKRTTQTQTRSTSATVANPLLPSPQGSPCVEGASERYDVANHAPTQDFVEFDTTKSIVFGYDEVPQI